MSASLLVAVVADELEGAALEVARSEGARGVTMLSARGIGFPEHVTFFGLTYRGLETVLLWVLDETTAARVSDRLNSELELLQPFKGLAFTLPVSETGGIDPAAIRDYIASNGQSDG